MKLGVSGATTTVTTFVTVEEMERQKKIAYEQGKADGKADVAFAAIRRAQTYLRANGRVF